MHVKYIRKIILSVVVHGVGVLDQASVVYPFQSNEVCLLYLCRKL